VAPTPSTIGPSYKGSRLRIENPAAGRASRNVQSLVPHGYKLVENHGSYIVVEQVDGQLAPGARPAGFVGPVAPAPGTRAATAAATAAAKSTTPGTTNQVWLDGRLVTIKLGADGQTYTATPAQGGKDFQGARPTAFGALDGSSIDPSSPFLMGRASTRPTGFVGPVATNASHMTVSGGVQWLAELSSKDPGAYASMLQKLYNAGYLSKGDLAAANGHWSAAAGQAFAEAARDTAVVNTTSSGLNTTLDDFLNSKAGAAAAAEGASGAAYKPTPRSYTDPEDIKANAKTEAEKVLGRQLNDAEEAQLVSHFRALEDAAYDQVDAAAGNGGARYTPPGMGQVDAYVEGPQHAQEAADWRAAGYGEALKGLIGLSYGTR